MGGTTGRYHVGLLCERLYQQIGASTSLRLPYCFTPGEASWCLHIIDTSTSVQDCLRFNTVVRDVTYNNLHLSLTKLLRQNSLIELWFYSPLNTK